MEDWGSYLSGSQIDFYDSFKNRNLIDQRGDGIEGRQGFTLCVVLNKIQFQLTHVLFNEAFYICLIKIL